MRRVILATCVLLAMGGAAEAESTKPVQRFVCVFDEHVSPETTRLSSKSPLRIEFIVDGTGHAFAVGRNVYPVKVIPGDNGITFLEVLVTGCRSDDNNQQTGESGAQPPHHHCWRVGSQSVLWHLRVRAVCEN